MDEDRGLAPGMEVGGYVIDGMLGRGGMGVVYSARHPVIGKRAAIKVLRPALSNNPAAIDRFLQEARAVNAIGHPNIIDIFAFDRLPDGRHYLVMDLLEGESLRTRLKRGPLHVRDATEVLDEIASALIAAHDKGFVHRDLKPDNVFLVARGGRLDVKLLDFGLAKLLPAAGVRAYRTATGAQLGTPDYMSPEQLRASDTVDARTDIYALGVMGCEIVSGKRPRRMTESFERDMLLAVDGASGVPRELAHLFATMLQTEPSVRPTLVAVRAVLKRVRPSLPQISAVDEPAIPLPSPAAPTATTVDGRVHRPALETPNDGIPTLERDPPRATGLAQALAQHPGTTVGVPPPPIMVTQRGMPPPPIRPPTAPSVFAPSQSQSQSQPRKRENRVWLLVGLALAVAAGIALAVVMIT